MSRDRKRRSVYEPGAAPKRRRFTVGPHSGRFVDLEAAEAAARAAPAWRPLGERDPESGRGDVDYSRASGWRPLSELWRRR